MPFAPVPPPSFVSAILPSPPDAEYGVAFDCAGRPRQDPRTRRVFSARVLDVVMRELAISNGQLARWCGVDEKLVRRWRGGDRAIAPHHFDRMRTVGVELRRRLNPSSS